MKKTPDLINKQVGKYQIINEISRGGMGVIFLGKHATLNRYAAVKMLFPHLAGEMNFVKRFREEMHAMSKVKHPNIVDIYDYEEQYNTYFIIMEVVIGRSLDSALKEHGVFELNQTLNIIRQVLSALNCAHKKGILHRDIKPSNIMINDQGGVKVLDFGIAKILGGQELTQTGYMVGTPQYLSPEQADGKDLTPASDLYSVSTVLFQMVTGRPPFEAENPMALMMSHIKDAPPKPRKLNSKVPVALEKIILKGLEKEPKKRFGSAAEMIDAIDKLMGNQKGSVRLKSGSKKSSKNISDAKTLIAGQETESESAGETLITDTGTIIRPSSSLESQSLFKSFLSQLSFKNSIGMGILSVLLVVFIWMGVSQTGRSVLADSWSSVVNLFVREPPADIETSKQYEVIPRDLPKSYGNVFGIQFEIIPSNIFTMGVKPGTTGSLDDSPDHEVRLETYFIGKYEITNSQYKLFIRDTGHSPPSNWPDGKCEPTRLNYPVTFVNWFDATMYCMWLSQKTGLTFRLPTEAEWERAAYSSVKFPWGDRWRANSANTLNSGRGDIAPVGSYSSDTSLTGVFDMGGNVQEWIRDYYAMSAYAVSRYENPLGPSKGSKRVVRGGAFNLDYKSARVTKRSTLDPRARKENLGFRVVLQRNNQRLS